MGTRMGEMCEGWKGEGTNLAGSDRHILGEEGKGENWMKVLKKRGEEQERKGEIK